MYRHLQARLRRSYRKARRFVVHSVLHADDPPHRLALGAAIAMFITFTPTVGIQMLLVVFFAWLMRANKVIGVPLVWISNPATVVPIFYGCYQIGALMLGIQGVDSQWWEHLMKPPALWGERVVFFWREFLHVAGPLWLGSAVVALLLAIPTYYGVYHGVCWYRMRRWGRLMPPDKIDKAKSFAASKQENIGPKAGLKVGGYRQDKVQG